MIRVVIADDHHAVRESLGVMLRVEPDIEVAGVGEDGHAALRLARELRPDVLVIDQSMPGPSGLDVARVISAELPAVAVILHSGDSTLRLAAPASGASAFIQKGAPHGELLYEIRRLGRRGRTLAALSAPRPRRRVVSWALDVASLRARILAAVLVVAAYALLFIAMDPWLGASAAMISVVPVLAGGGLLGVRGGLAITLLTLAVSGLLLTLLGHQSGDVILRLGGGLGALSLAAIGAGMGWMRDLRARADARAREVEALSTAAQVVAAGALTGDTLRSILRATTAVVPAQHAMLLVPRDGGAVLEILAGVGTAASWIGHRRDSGLGVIGRCFRSGSVQLLGEARRDADYLPWIETARSLLCAPIVLRAKVTGVIALLDDARGHFQSRDADLLRAFAAHAAIALETDRLFRAAGTGRVARL